MLPLHKRSAWLLIAALAFAVSACGRAAPAPSAQPAIRPVEAFDPLSDPPTEALAPAWSRRYPAPASVAVAADGSMVTVAGPLGPGGQLAVELLRAGGERAWLRPLGVPGSLRATLAALEPGAGQVVAVVSRRDESGAVLALSLAGRLLWRREVEGPAQVRLSRDGEMAAVIDHGAGRLVLLDAAGNEAAVVPVSPGAAAEFLAGGYLLLSDRSYVAVLGPDGRPVRRFEVDEDLRRQLAVHPDGRRVAVTTSKGADAVYLFSVDARTQRVEWLQSPLYPGGRNLPRFGAGGDALYVFDVGDRAGLYAFSADDLAVRWRLFARGRDLALARVGAGSEGLLAHYVPADAAGAQALVRITAGGRPVRRLDVGSFDALHLARSSDRLAVAVLEGRDEVELRVFTLAPLSSAR